MAFQGFPKEMFEFFMALSFNNNEEFFHKNHQSYVSSIRDPLYDFCEALQEAALFVDPGMETRPAKVVSRIRRDTRYSNNKLPYRDHMWMSFRRQGLEKSECFVLYFDISCENIHYGAGWYHDDPARAKAIRAAILRRTDDFLKIVTEPSFLEEFRFGGDPYKKLSAPENLPKELRPYYLSKGFYVEHGEKTGGQVLREGFADQVSKGFRLLRPLYDFMLEEAHKRADEKTEKSAWEGFYEPI